MELALLHHAPGRDPLLQLSVVADRQREQILPLVLLLVSNPLDFLLDDQTQPGQDREEVDDPNQYDQGVPDLNVVLGVQQHDHGLGQFEVPLVAHVAVVLVADAVQVVGELVAEAELGDEAGVLVALLVEDLARLVPAHDGLEHAVEEAAVSDRFVFRAGCDRVGDVAK